MKFYQYFLVLLAAGLLAACGNNTTQEGEEGEDTEEAEGDLPESPEDAGHKTAVCIWDGIGIWAEHTPKLDKWQASLSMGDEVEILEQIEKEEKGKAVTYLKVRQPDTDKEGWVASYYVVPGGKAMAVTEELDLYTRPALVAKANALLQPFDVVAVTAEKDDWVRITGKRRSGSWIDQDKWIKNRGLSSKEEDLAIATLVTRALKEKDDAKRLSKLQEIYNTKELKDATLYSQLDALITEVEESGADIAPLDTSATAGVE